MNRKDRRAAGANRGVPAAAAGPAAPVLTQLFSTALGHHRAGRLGQAEELYRRILTLAPDHADTLHYLGVLAHQVGRHAAAADLIAQAIAKDARASEYHYNLGVVLEALQRGDDAVASYRAALALKPDHARACLNIGNVLLGQNRLDDAEAACRRAIALAPGSADAPFNLGAVFMRRERLDLAIAQFRRAVALQPDHAAAHASLGAAHLASGDLDQAEQHSRRAYTLDPHNPMNAAYFGLTQWFRGDVGPALDLALQALERGDSPPARFLFARAARYARVTHDDRRFRALVARALVEDWDVRPDRLMGPALDLLKLTPVIAAAIARAADADRRVADPGGPDGHAGAVPDGTGELADHAVDLSVDQLADQLAGDRLLDAVLATAPVCDMAVERMLAALRRGLLARATAEPAVTAAVLQLFCAVAQQCFVTEYAYAVADAERDQAAALAAAVVDAVARGIDVAPLWIVAVGAYLPLDRLAAAERLLERRWPAPVAALLQRQVAEPRAQREPQAALPRLTAVEDRVSVAVKQQYEDNPYPRWIRLGRPVQPTTLDAHIATKFPRVAYRPLGKPTLDVLIAGCGTGAHAIATAQNFVGADVLAVDLSATSLGYAAFKTRERGLANVQYAVADLLALDTLGRSFDLIEASGVLHHLADPFAGWRKLIAILRPGGVMNVGLYSERGRAEVVRARAFIAEQGYPATADGIRDCRQAIARSDDPVLRQVMELGDFYSLSGCRDLLFHVQEHRLNLPQIAAFLAEQGLTLLGFDADLLLLKQYQSRFPDDTTKTDLAAWDAFEREHPRSFSGMYQFWIQKPA